MEGSLNHWQVAPDTLILLPGEVHVWRVGLEVTTSRLAALQAVLSAEERRRAARFAFEKDRLPWIVARGALRLLLSHYCDAPPDALAFHSNAYGKLSVASPASAQSLRFNLSHSHHLALYAFSWQQEVGIDVEYLREGVELEALSKQCFSHAEQMAWQALAATEKQRAFFRCWTRKEAYIKARGMGLSLPLDVFDVTIGPQARLLASREDPGEVRRWSCYDVEMGESYAGALFVEGAPRRVCCWQWAPTEKPWQ